MPDTLTFENAYAFDLHVVCGGYAYFSTFTMWITDSKDGRQVRKPSIVSVPNFKKALHNLALSAMAVKDIWDLQYWLVHRGWALVPDAFAKSVMAHWMQSRECLISPSGTFTDVEIAAPSAKKQSVLKRQQEAILERDAGRCILCGATASEAKLTMHHIKPHSQGGETTSQNLICLCEPCNHGIANNELPDLYDLAGLHSGFDRGLLKGTITPEAVRAAYELSDNLMHSRCVVS